MASRFRVPGIYVEETPIAGGVVGAPTGILALVGCFPEGPLEPCRIHGLSALADYGGAEGSLAAAVLAQFFAQGGTAAWVVRTTEEDETALRAGLDFLGEIAGAFDLLAVPNASVLPGGGANVYLKAAAICDDNRAFLLVDHPQSANSLEGIKAWNIQGVLGIAARSAALCFPKLSVKGTEDGLWSAPLPASGSIAGLIARTDSTRGVWKAPAGMEATLTDVRPDVRLTDAEQGEINPRGLNAVRIFPHSGAVNWGARTLAGSDALASEWKYISVRRMAQFLERTFLESFAWTAFEMAEEGLFARLRLDASGFLHGLFRKGAFQGRTPREAWFVKCDTETTTSDDIAQHVVNLVVGFAPLKPAEFVVLNLKLPVGGS